MQPTIIYEEHKLYFFLPNLSFICHVTDARNRSWMTHHYYCTFFNGTQNEMFSWMFRLLFSIHKITAYSGCQSTTKKCYWKIYWKSSLMCFKSHSYFCIFKISHMTWPNCTTDTKSEERKSYRFGTTWKWVNSDRIAIIVQTNHLTWNRCGSSLDTLLCCAWLFIYLL